MNGLPVSSSMATQALPKSFSTPVRSLDTPFVVSTTRPAHVGYNIDTDVSVSVSLTGSDTSTAEVLLQIRPTPGSGAWTTIDKLRNSKTLSVTVSLVTIATTEEQEISKNLAGVIPAGYEVILASATVGTATAAVNAIQSEVLI